MNTWYPRIYTDCKLVVFHRNNVHARKNALGMQNKQNHVGLSWKAGVITGGIIALIRFVFVL